MPFTARWTREATDVFEKLTADALSAQKNRLHRGKTKASRQEGLFKQVTKALNLLLQDPRHPGLATHQYDSIPHPYSSSEKVFEAYAQNNTPGAYRIFWCYGPGKSELTIIAITPHP